METPDNKSEDMVRAVRAVFNSFVKPPIIGSLIVKKSIYFAINLEWESLIIVITNKIKIIKVKIKLLEKKLPNQTIILVENGNATSSSLKVLARVGTTKA